MSQSSSAFLSQLCRAADTRWPKDTNTLQRAARVEAIPADLRRKAASSLSSSAFLSNLALAIITTAVPQNAPISNNCTLLCLKSPREAGPFQHLGTPMCASTQRLSSRSSRRERERERLKIAPCVTGTLVIQRLWSQVFWGAREAEALPEELSKPRQDSKTIS